MRRLIFGRNKLHKYLIAILNNASIRGIPLPSREYILILNKVITDFDNSGFWDLLDIFHFFAGGNQTTQEFKCINWINPGLYYGQFRGNLSNAFVDYGLDGNITQSGFNADAVNFISGKTTGTAGKFSLNNASVGTLVFRPGPDLGDVSTYVGIATIRSGVSLTPSVGNWQRLNATNSGANIDFTGTGLMILNRTSNVDINGIKKNVQTLRNTTSTSIQDDNFSALIMGGVYHTSAGLSFLFSGQNIPFSISQSVRQTMNEKYFRALGLSEIA